MPLVRPQTGLILPPTNKLAYPAGTKAGFYPSHVASRDMSPGHGLSAVTISPGSMFNILRGRLCSTTAGNESFAINVIGLTITSAGGVPNAITDTGNAAVVDTGQTLAGIIFYQSAHTDNPVIIGSGNVYQSAWYFYVDGTTKQLGTYTASAALSGIVLNNNEAYFVAVSNDGSNLYFIAKSLTTGSLRTAKVAATGNVTSFTSSGSYQIQADTFVNQAVFPIAAVSYTPAFLSPSELSQWANDPWSFWYPRQTQMLVSTEAATQYAAFSIPQRGGRTITQMRGY